MRDQSRWGHTGRGWVLMMVAYEIDPGDNCREYKNYIWVQDVQWTDWSLMTLTSESLKTCGFLLTHQFIFPSGYLSWSPWRQKTIFSFWSGILSARDSKSLKHHGNFGDQDLDTYYLTIYWSYHLDNMCPHVSRLLSGVCVFFKSGTEAAGE